MTPHFTLDMGPLREFKKRIENIEVDSIPNSEILSCLSPQNEDAILIVVEDARTDRARGTIDSDQQPVFLGLAIDLDKIGNTNVISKGHKIPLAGGLETKEVSRIYRETDGEKGDIVEYKITTGNSETDYVVYKLILHPHDKPIKNPVEDAEDNDIVIEEKGTEERVAHA